MRLRNLALIAVPVLLLGSGIWFFVSGSNDNTIGAGGLPLIKADPNPVKLPPDDPGGEIMPNADSTVFPAMGADGTDADPSMENLKLPATPAPEDQSNTADFAGLKTGFTVPVAPEKKTESLFDTAPKTIDAPVTAEHKDYVSGMAPEALAEATPAPERTPAPVAETPPPPEQKTEEKKVEEPVAPIADDAQDMEAQEKGLMIHPPVKPPVPGEAATQTPKETPRAPQVSADEKAEAQKSVAEAVANEAYRPSTPLPATPQPAEVSKGYYIQLASTTSKTEAQTLWARLQKKYANALAGLSPVYQTVTIPGKGDYIRVQAGPLAQSEANDRCKGLHLIDPKGGCLVLRR